MNNEPLVTAAVITSVITALITLLKAFGIPITEDQQAAINQFAAIVAPIALGILARQWVTPLANPKAADGEPLVRASGSTRSAAVKKP